MASDELVTVYTAKDSIQAEIVKNALEAEGMRCFLEQEDQGAFSGLMTLSVKVQVPADQAEEARRFVLRHEGSHEEGDEEEPDTTEGGTETGIREGV